MKRILTFVAVFIMATRLYATDSYKIDPSHTTIGFSVAHLVINEVEGRFRDFEGTVTLDKSKITGLKGSIRAKSIDTGIADRDKHLRSADFFDVEKHPTITFETKAVKSAGRKQVLVGSFTMHGVTKDVQIPVTVKGPIQDPWGKTRIGMKATLTIDRKDYGLTWNKMLETGGLVVGNEVEIEINAEAVKE